jgi:hypothetical protein
MTDVRGRLNKALSDRYHIERELGQGGMATVYLAEDVRHKRKVALKAGTSWRRLESALPLIPLSADSAKPVPGLTPRDQLSRWSPALADRYRIEREMGQDGMATVIARRGAIRSLSHRARARQAGWPFVYEAMTLMMP